MLYISSSARYGTDYGMFRFCVADTEHDWREGSKQYEFIEHCLASADRQKQPWLIFLAHRVLGYSSCTYYAVQGSFAEPMGRDSLQKLWQKYKVDIAIFGHVHNYERTCPIYQVLRPIHEAVNICFCVFAAFGLLESNPSLQNSVLLDFNPSLSAIS